MTTTIGPRPTQNQTRSSRSAQRESARSGRPAGGAVERGRARCAVCRAGLPSSSAGRRHHAQQGGLPRHEGPQRPRMGAGLAGVALQLSRHGIEPGRARRPGRGRRSCSPRWTGWKTNTSLPLVVVGFSFGAAMALSACCSSCPAPGRARDGLARPAHPRPTATIISYSWLQNCTLPKLFLSGDRDPFAAATRSCRRSSPPPPNPATGALSPRRSLLYWPPEPMQTALAGWLVSILKEQLR